MHSTAESRPAGPGPDVPMVDFIPECSGVCGLWKTVWLVFVCVTQCEGDL